MSCCLHACLPAYLPAYLHTCLSACLSTYLSACLPSCLSVGVRPAWLFICLSWILPACLPAFLLTSLPSCFHAFLSVCFILICPHMPACIPAFLPVFLPTCLPVCNFAFLPASSASVCQTVSWRAGHRIPGSQNRKRLEKSPIGRQRTGRACFGTAWPLTGQWPETGGCLDWTVLGAAR